MHYNCQRPLNVQWAADSADGHLTALLFKAKRTASGAPRLTLPSGSTDVLIVWTSKPSDPSRLCCYSYYQQSVYLLLVSHRPVWYFSSNYDYTNINTHNYIDKMKLSLDCHEKYSYNMKYHMFLSVSTSRSYIFVCIYIIFFFVMQKFMDCCRRLAAMLLATVAPLPMRGHITPSKSTSSLPTYKWYV